MATIITEECINCGACEPECPNTAIFQGGVEYEWNGATQAAISEEIFFIVPEKCTECVGFYDYEACAAVCPVDCCVTDQNNIESEDVLAVRAKEIHPDKDFPDPIPSRFNPTATEKPAAADAATNGDAGTGVVTGVPMAAGPVASVKDPADFDVPVVCQSCSGEYTVAYRYFHPGTVLRCPHCMKNYCPTQRVFLAIGDRLDAYIDGVNAEVDRYNDALEDAQRRFDGTTTDLEESAARDIRNLVREQTEPRKRSIFG